MCVCVYVCVCVCVCVRACVCVCVKVRYFRVVDEQDECPPGSGVACLHGELS